MKSATEQLTRLLKAAAGAPAVGIDSPSPFIENRIIAQWRSGLAAEELFSPVLFFRRALACAFVVMVIAFAWSYRDLSEPPASHVAVAEYEMTFVP